MYHQTTRRQFLATSTVAAGATFFDLPGIVHAAEGKPYYGGLPMGIQSYTLRNFETDQVIRHVKGLGLRYVEFYRKHLSPNASPDQIKQLQEKLAGAGIKLTAHGVQSFTKDDKANRKFFEFAKAAGVRTITANPQPDSFDSLDKLVEEFQIRIAIHNHGPGALYDGLETVTERVKGRHKLIGACVDTGHVLRSGENPVDWVHKLGPRVFALHVKDVAEMRKRTHDVIIGEGHLDVVGIFKGLRKIKFPADGTLSIEYESHPDNPLDDVTRCLAIAKEAIAKSAG